MLSRFLRHAGPLLGPLLFLLALWALHGQLAEYSWDDLVVYLETLSPKRLASAFGLTVASYATITAYDWLAGGRSLGASRLLSARDTVAALPGVRQEGLVGGIAYMDARFDDARLAITLMRSVFDLGGLAINYLPVTALRHEAGRVAGVEAHDAEHGERLTIAARVVINAGGVWADALRQLDDREAPARLAPSQGAHVVVDRDFLPGDDALLIPRTDDGRVLFVIPWQGKLLLGTTDTPCAELPTEPMTINMGPSHPATDRKSVV